MSLNRKGFTLIELLVTIVIVSLIIGLSTYGIIQIVNSSKEQGVALSESSLKEAARTYSSEVGSDSWKKTNDYDVFCVTVGELMNKGLLDKNGIISEKGIEKNSFIVVKRNKVTLAIEKEEIAKNGDANYSLCTDSTVADNEVVVAPKIDGYISYTDRIEISFEEGSATYQGNSSEVSYKCLYGESSSNINKTGTIEDDKCILDGLRNNNDYYVIIYMNTNNGSSVVAEGENNYKTSDLNAPDITQNDNVVTIYYDDKDSNGNNVNSPSHYFSSSYNGTSDKNVYVCDLKNNVFTCNENSTTNITSNVWYKVIEQEVKITYPDDSSLDVTVNARIYDKSNNYAESEEHFVIDRKINNVNIKYSVNGGSITASSGGYSWTTDSSGIISRNGSAVFHIIESNGTLNNVDLIDYNNSTYMNITRTGYKAVSGSEWKCLSGDCAGKTFSQASSYSASDFCDASSSDCTVTLGINWTSNTVNIKYSTNGGTITALTGSNSWTTDSSGIISLNGANVFATVNYGSSLSSSGLADYNNATYMNIARTGYKAVSGAEWICISDNCKDKTYDQTKVYSASDFCDASSSDCTVTLGVNWTSNTVNIKYSTNGGTITASTGSNSWTTDSSGIILKNSSVLLTSVSYGGTLGSAGLANYNNSSNIYITRTGYKAVSGSEWKCLSDNCKDKTYDQAKVYSASDFCDASSSDCTVTLGVNWTLNAVNIKYSTNGGTITASTGSNSWTTDSSNIVYKNGSVLLESISYGSSLGSDGLANYNNGSYLKITNTGYHGVSGAEWTCLSGDCAGKTFSQASSYSASDFCDASSSDCTVTVGVNWTINKVNIKYSTNGGTITASTGSNSWTTDSDGIISRNGSVLLTSASYGGTLTSDGLNNYNNSNYIYITKSGYFVNSGSEWKCLSGCKESGKVYSQTTVYNASDFCDASSSDCTVTVGVNWVSGTLVNANRYTCNTYNDESDSRLAVYYVTTCTNGTCSYNKKYGLSSSYSFSSDIAGTPTWSISESSISASIPSDCDRYDFYVKSDVSLACLTGASTSITTAKKAYDRCTFIENVYRTTMKNGSYSWYYDSTNDCYLDGNYLGSNVCDTSTGSTRRCGECSSDSDCGGGSCNGTCTYNGSSYSCCTFAINGSASNLCN